MAPTPGGRRRRPTRGAPRAPLAGRPLSRRALLRAAGAGLVAPATASLLAACGDQLYTSGTFVLASPDNPVRWPLSATHPRIEPGQRPRPGSTLRLYNYADYLGPGVVKAFEAEYDVKVTISTFNDTDEALTKIATGAVAYDIYFPSYDQIGKMVASDLLRPLTQEYLTNVDALWDEFRSPWYDVGARYSVPYSVYSTGIGWRTDMVDADVSTLTNPYDVFWDPANRGNVAVIDDWHTTMSLVLLRNGITDVNSGKARHLDTLREQLSAMQDATDPKVTIQMYNDLPGGQYGISMMWSGDIVNAQYYLPKDVPVDVLRYWFPPDGRGMVDNDLMVLLGSGENPVAAHHFINYLLDPDVAARNFFYTGYQPPQASIDPERVVADGYVPPDLATAAVRPVDFERGFRLLELEPVVDGEWHAIWQEYKARG
jgi:spermidine/putrescine transport system substrate-binding protein